MKIGMTVRTGREDAYELSESIHKILVENGHKVDFNIFHGHDMEIVIGGDGTILGVVNCMGEHQSPILGINMGGVGFLADIEPEDAISYIKNIKDSIEIETRMRINVRNGDKNPLGVALNEVAILTRDSGKVINFTIIVDGIEVQSFRADGLIISTPTGSTAYAMSAGGSIVDPLVHDGYLVVPVAPYLLSSRPQIISARRRLEIMVGDLDNACIVVDGKRIRNMNNNVPVEIYVDAHPAKFVNVNRNFFKKVGDKLRRM
jgi:NAD+ kinase